MLAVLVTAYAALFSCLSLRKYLHYLYTDFDLAIFAQAVDRLRHGSTWNSIRGMDWRGDHSSWILYGIAPLTWAFPPGTALLVLQSVALALGAIPVFRLGRRLLNDSSLALACALLYLLYPALGYVNLFEFHPEALSVPLLLAALEALVAGHTRRTQLWSALALLGKEDVVLPVLGIAALALLLPRPRRWRLAAALAALAACSLAITFFWLRPAYSHGEVDYAQMYSAWGASPGAALVTLLRNPLRAIAALVSTPNSPVDTMGKLQFYPHVLLPLGLLPLLAPEVLVMILPMLAQHMLSARGTEHAITYHYTAELIPFLMVAAVVGLAKLRSRRGLALAWWGVGLALAASLASNVLFGPVLGHRWLQKYAASEPLAPDHRAVTLQDARDRMIARVPGGEGVVASFEFQAKLAARANLQSFHHVFSGRYTLSTKPYPPARGIHALLASLGNQWDEEGARRLRDLVADNDLRPVDEANDLVLYLRGAGDTLALLDPVDSTAPDSARVVYEGQLAFLGAELPQPRVPPGEPLVIRTDWKRVAAGDRVFLTLWTLMDANDRIALYHTRYLGYGLWTPDRWPLGRPLRETFRLVIPPHVVPGRYRLVMEVGMRKGDLGGMAAPDDPRLAAAGSVLPLGIVEVGKPRAAP